MVEGWLLKKTGGAPQPQTDGRTAAPQGLFDKIFHKWEYRYFVVLRSKLNYFRSPEAYHQGVAPMGTIDLRIASMWEYEREEEKVKGRIHKFVVATPAHVYYMCSEQREELEMWFEGIAAVICQAMRAWSPTEVSAWLAINGLAHLSAEFEESLVNGIQLNTFDCKEGLAAVDAAREERQPGGPPLVGSEEDRGRLIEAVQMVNRSGPRAASGAASATLQEQVRTRVAAAAQEGGGCELFLCCRPGQQELAKKFIGMLPVAEGAAPWSVFVGDGQLKPAGGAPEPEPEPEQQPDGSQSLPLETEEEMVQRHYAALEAAANFVVLCTSGFFDPMQIAEGTQDVQHMMVAKALEMSASMNIICVYAPGFKIPRPGKIPELLRPLVKHDFHKFDHDLSESAAICAESIAFDLISDRNAGAADMKTEWGSVGLAVQALNDVEPGQLERQAECMQAFQLIVTTLDGERQFYEHHGVEALATALGYTQGAEAGANEDRAVCDLALLRHAVLTFAIMSFNSNDHDRYQVIGLENGIAALVNSLLRLGTMPAPARPDPEAEEVPDPEEELLELSCRLFQRLALSDLNLRELRSSGAVKVLKACLASNNRDLRETAEATMSQVLTLADN